MHRYVQLLKVEVKVYEEKHKLLRECGMKYVDWAKNMVFYEFHVDATLFRRKWR